MTAGTDEDSVEIARERQVRILIVDDSVVARRVLHRILTGNRRMDVVRTAHHAGEAIDFLSNEKVDLILLDIEMPGESGLVALPTILRLCGDSRVVILSSNCAEGSAASVQALALGAADVISKPESGAFGDAFANALIQRLLRLADGLDRMPDNAAPEGLTLAPVREGQPISCLGLGASTGGIHALGQFFTALTKRPGVPILLTQHLPPSFIPYFAGQLARMTPMRVKVAEQGEALLADTVYIAPGEAHLGSRQIVPGRAVVELSSEKAAHAGIPAVDPMFSAMAATYGAGAVGIVLTGMGRDGTAGARRIIAEGGQILAQDRESCVVWGMPGSVARAGLASALLPPDGIAALVNRQLLVPA